jgi:hypothetical protein
MLSGGCYVDKNCKEVAIRCATCQKRLEFEVMLMAKSKKREVDLKSKRNVLRGIKLPEEKPQEVVTGEKEETVVLDSGGLPPSFLVPPPVRKPVKIAVWLASREQEMRRMAKKMKKVKKQKPSKKEKPTKKDKKLLHKKMKQPKGKKGKKQGKHKHHDEEE